MLNFFFILFFVGLTATAKGRVRKDTRSDVYEMSDTIAKVNEVYNMIDERKYKTALKLCGAAEKKHPNHPLIMTLKAYCYAKDGMGAEALGELEKVKTCKSIDDHVLNLISTVCNVLRNRILFIIFSFLPLSFTFLFVVIHVIFLFSFHFIVFFFLDRYFVIVFLLLLLLLFHYS